LGHAFGRECEVLDVQRRIRFEGDDVTLIAQVELRTAPCTDCASGEAELVEVDRAEVLAIATILPSNRNGMFAETFEIKLTE
jgi:hypothetical protein